LYVQLPPDRERWPAHPAHPLANISARTASSLVVEIAARLLCAPASPPVASVTRFSPGHAAEDSRLVREARGGDASAFERLYERYARVIHGVVLARVGRVDVDDLVQDVFLAAWARLATLRDPQAFGGWLTSIARRRAIRL